MEIEKEIFKDKHKEIEKIIQDYNPNTNNFNDKNK